MWPLAHVERVGFENIPSHGPCLVASNHVNNLDIFFLTRHMPRFPHCMAKQELFQVPLLGQAIRWGGSFPVHRGVNDRWALRQAGRILEAGNTLLMFPEGTRSGRKAKLRRGSVGAVKLALEYQVPIVPAAILGTHNFRPGFRNMNKIRLELAPPLDVVALAGPPEHRTLRQITTLVMENIAAMLPPAQRGVYAKE